MKKRNLIILQIFSLLFLAQINAQDKPGKRKIEAAKIGLITNRLNITNEQAPLFWPVYNEYEDKKAEIKKSLRIHLSESRSLASSDEKILAEIKEVLALRQKEVDLEREYMNKFLKVINTRQYSEFLKTDFMFKQLLLKKLEKREGRE